MEQDRIMKVSMLLDDELNEKDALSLLDQIEFDDRLRAKWFRYNAASLALKSDSVVALQPDLVERVRRSIAVDQPAPAAEDRPRRWLWPVTAFAGAVAASLAIVSVFIVGKMPESAGVPEQTLVAERSVESPSPEVLPVAAGPLSEEARFHGYLMNHSESAYSMGAMGMLPYARVVSYSANQH